MGNFVKYNIRTLSSVPILYTNIVLNKYIKHYLLFYIFIFYYNTLHDIYLYCKYHEAYFLEYDFHTHNINSTKV